MRTGAPILGECERCRRARLIDEQYGGYDEMISLMEGPEMCQKVHAFRSCRDSNADAEDRYWKEHFKDIVPQVKEHSSQGDI